MTSTATDEPDVLVDVADVRYVYNQGALKREVLHGVSARIVAREIVIITGPSGSGKTTFLTLIGGLRQLQSGSIRLAGLDLAQINAAELAAARRAIGFVFQQHHLLPALTAQENVQIPLALEPGLDTKAIRLRAFELLKAVGLADHADKRPAQLSGGQRQRVAIARALACRPRIILADEPTASLDAASGRDIVEILQRLARAEGCAVLIATHDIRILDIADRVLHLEDGHIEESDLRVSRLRAELSRLAGRIAAAFGTARPDTSVAGAMAVATADIAELAKAAQTHSVDLAHGLPPGATRDQVLALQRASGELAALAKAVATLGQWFGDPEAGAPMPVFEAVDALLLTFADAATTLAPDDIAMVETMAHGGSLYVDRAMRAKLPAVAETKLFALVGPIPFLIGSIMEKLSVGL
jgi:putative ABC transport system ATP-binding protein